MSVTLFEMEVTLFEVERQAACLIGTFASSEHRGLGAGGSEKTSIVHCRCSVMLPSILRGLLELAHVRVQRFAMGLKSLLSWWFGVHQAVLVVFSVVYSKSSAAPAIGWRAAGFRALHRRWSAR